MGSYFTKTTKHTVYSHTSNHHPAVYESRLITKFKPEQKFVPRTRWVSRSYFDGHVWRSNMVPEIYTELVTENKTKLELETHSEPEYHHITVTTNRGNIPIFTDAKNYYALLGKIKMDSTITEVRRYGVHITIPEWQYSGFILPNHQAICSLTMIGALLVGLTCIAAVRVIEK